MGVSSHFFVGSPEEAADIDGPEKIPAERQALFYKVMFTSLAALYEAMQGSECPEFKIIAHDEDYAVVTMAAPTEFVDLIAKLKDDEVAAAIEVWKESDEPAYDNDGDMNDLLEALRRLTQLAQQRDEIMYVQMCA
ncbi:hypothetical protein [Blastopirellula marina]|uniref:Uncharacterized protein n=1 Tax=Blastopirellula marina TaxID=124 RepID=A0A2S8G6B8_9BACT|nr:hypothetical protein [Blastopirellula marina]PQO39967.1 hypothetical protein C5Y98_06515 [Blastopirellula marina]PTL45342.1 hypothetical protein C5Y97_06515 [Blastopirellula marina]